MRASDLSPPERRLLRRAARVEPHATKIEPKDESAAVVLRDAGLIAIVPMFGGRFEGAEITDAGRAAR